MESTTPNKVQQQQVSEMAAGLKGSEIIKLAGEIKSKQQAGAKIFNFTIGDFDPSIFPIPEKLRDAVISAYTEGHTNYPASNGLEKLRKVLSVFMEREMNLAYQPDQFLVAGGGRPLIFGFYQAVLDRDEEVLFPVPSWNNNHYTHLSHGQQRMIETRPEHNFMPTAADLEPYLSRAGIVALCSPLNPTGTVFSKEALDEICVLILKENERRKGRRKPLYLLFDQIYWQLTFAGTVHYHPVGLQPAMRDYTVYVDGISKAYAATGVRVGWAFGPEALIGKMKSILGHVGAWAPKPEQEGTADFMANADACSQYMGLMTERLHRRLNGFYKGFAQLKAEGLPVDAITPQAAMYLAVKIDLVGLGLPSGKLIESQQEVTAYLLDEAGVALVPFGAFGASSNSPWYRLSVGTARTEEIETVIEKIRLALNKLS